MSACNSRSSKHRSRPAATDIGMTALRIVAWVVGGLAVIVLAIAAVGWMLPVSHRATRRATFAASPAQIYALITDVDSFPKWRSKIASVEASGCRWQKILPRDW